MHFPVLWMAYSPSNHKEITEMRRNYCWQAKLWTKVMKSELSPLELVCSRIKHFEHSPCNSKVEVVGICSTYDKELTADCARAVITFFPVHLRKVSGPSRLLAYA